MNFHIYKGIVFTLFAAIAGSSGFALDRRSEEIIQILAKDRVEFFKQNIMPYIDEYESDIQGLRFTL